MSGTFYTTVDGDTLPYICWRHYGAGGQVQDNALSGVGRLGSTAHSHNRQNSGFATLGTVEAVLEANRDLAELGHIYPAGIRIWLPEMNTNELAAIRIWD